MKNDYFIVHKSILPEYLEKVIQARDLLHSHEVETVKEATLRVGISRNTYYKYKDYVFTPKESQEMHRAVINLVLRDVSGALAAVIATLTENNTSILTISQSVPIRSKANVMISLDITNISCSMDTLITELKKIDAVRSAHLEAMD